MKKRQTATRVALVKNLPAHTRSFSDIACPGTEAFRVAPGLTDATSIGFCETCGRGVTFTK